MRRGLVAGAVAALLTLTGSGDALAGARASGGEFGIVFGGPGRVVRQTQAPMAIQGRVEVEFHGDRASGCAFLGTCDTAGHIVWDPGPRGTLLVLDTVLGGHRQTDGVVFLASGLDEPASVVAQVRRGLDGAVATCADAGRSNAAPTLDPAGPGRLRFDLTGFGGEDLFATRCGGPLQADVARALPSPRVSLAAMRRGRLTVALPAERGFAGHGFAGTVRSSLVFRLGHPRRTDEAAPAPASLPVRRRRARVLTAVYRVERVTGRVRVALRGQPDPGRCAPLDACGLEGKVDLTARATSGEAALTAQGPATVPRSRFRAALGLMSGPSRGVESVHGGANWSGPGTAVQSQTWQTGGFCGSAIPARTGSLDISVVGRRVTVRYSGGYGDGNPLRGRCPGPLLSELGGALLSTSVPLRTFRARRIVLRLRRGNTFTAEAHMGSTSGDVKIVLRRLAIRESSYLDFAPI
ncbi:MAG: hypothetical protein QOE65_674 [Solirubrobacteraceae bacterium]|nr:hypothetical protein [Solirubrobacteraceae bacterium]